MKKILIIYSSGGGLGHKVVAENIAQALRDYPRVKVRLLDIFEFYRGPFMRISKQVYLLLVFKLPALWRFFYTNELFNKLTLPLRLPVAAIKAKKLARYLHKHKPDLILTSQTTATAVVSYLKQTQAWQGRLVTTFSDYHFQPYWHYQGVDLFLAMTDEQKLELGKLGVPESQAAVIGLPVDKAFAREYRVSEVIKHFQLPRAKPLILVMGGSRGWGIDLAYIRELLATPYEVEVGVLAGDDKVKLRQLKRLTRKASNLRVFGQLPNQQVAQLFSVARILVSKPGGLTIAQALVSQLPTVWMKPLPGGEELNLAFLRQHGLGQLAASPPELRQWIERLLLDKEFYRQLEQRMQELAQPAAAHLAAERIIDNLKT